MERNIELLFTSFQAKSSLVKCIKATQYKDERLCKDRDEVLASKRKNMTIDRNCILRISNQLFVLDKDMLRQIIFEELTTLDTSYIQGLV